MSRISDINDAMDRALILAHRSPRVGPDNDNPPVGCVIIDGSGRIVAEGWHRGAGTDHAEVDALKQLERTRPPSMSPADLTAVVTLEPCNHHGRTGPCSQALLEAGIRSVAYGSNDPGDASAGGAEYLLRSGVTVFPRIQQHRCDGLLREWLALTQTSPAGSVLVKWAQSLDGRVAAADGSSQWITSDESRADVHLQRASADLIVVGTGTLLADDPALTARRPDGQLSVSAEQQPVPVVIGRRSIPPQARVRQHPALSVHSLDAPIQLSGEDLTADLAGLFQRWGAGTRIFVEGGPHLASSIIRAGLATEVLVYTAPVLLGGPYTALDALGVSTLSEALELQPITEHRLGPDRLLHAGLLTRHTGDHPDHLTRTTEEGEDRVHRTR